MDRNKNYKMTVKMFSNKSTILFFIFFPGAAYVDLPGDILRARVASSSIEYCPQVPLPPPITLPVESGLLQGSLPWFIAGLSCALLLVFSGLKSGILGTQSPKCLRQKGFQTSFHLCT